MGDRRWSDTDRELVAVTLASRTRYSQHGQMCPVWTRRPKGVRTGDDRTPTGAELARCDCWRMAWARRDADRVLDALTSAGWRPARDYLPAASEALDRLAARVAEEIAQAIETQAEIDDEGEPYGPAAYSRAAAIARAHATTPGDDHA